MTVRNVSFEVIASAGPAQVGESPFWDAAKRRLSYVDVLAGWIEQITEGGNAERVNLGGFLTTAIPMAGAESEWLVAHGRQIELLDAATSTVRGIASIDHNPAPEVQFNDGKCDAAGRLWIGTMCLDRPGLGELHCLDPGGSLRVAAADLNLPNGLGWSADGRTLYLVDSRPGLLYAFDFDIDNGEIARRRLISDRLGTGQPDGLAIAEDDSIWIAFWEGSSVRRFAPDGRLLAEYDLPVSLPTSVAFTDEHLIVTSGLVTLTAEERANQPAGRVLFGDCGHSGVPTHRPSSALMAAGQSQ